MQIFSYIKICKKRFSEQILHQHFVFFSFFSENIVFW